MNEDTALNILREMTCCAEINSLKCGCPLVAWPNGFGRYEEIGLDGGFTADQLEALAWWMRNNVNKAAAKTS